MSTLHTLDAVETVNRIIGMFPPHQQKQIRLALAAVLKGVISQRLVPRADGKGMVPAVEILVHTARIRELIEDPKRTREIRDAIANGRNPYGMMTFDQCLADLVQRRLITYETALSSSTTPDDFALQFRGVSKAGEAVTPGQAAECSRRRACRVILGIPRSSSIVEDSSRVKRLAEIAVRGRCSRSRRTPAAASDKPTLAVRAVQWAGRQSRPRLMVVRTLRKKATHRAA